MTLNAPVAATYSANLRQQPDRLSFVSVTKRFGNVLANDRISFEVESGGIHAIVGENGAGKSTLTKILYGYYGSDAGSIIFNGSEITLDSPSQARRLGIGMVHQQLTLVPSLTGVENVLLGDPTLPFAFSRRNLEKKMSSRAHELGLVLNLSCPVSDLSIAERQKLEIFKLLWRDARVLILDEPTSQLTPFEAEDILRIVEGLASKGRIVVLITHHIAEVMRFAKRITVLRKGRCITTIDAASIDSDELAGLMVDANDLPAVTAGSTKGGMTLMHLKDVSSGKTNGSYSIKSINLEIRSGEVIGVAGISGSGQAELGRLIAGLLPPAEGTIVCPSQPAGCTLNELVCYIPSDQSHAFAPALSVASNCFLKSINASWSHTMGFIKGSLVRSHAGEVIDSFGITPPLMELPASALSGGNLQRLIIGRELSTPARVVVADNPCAGLDAAMAMRVRHELRRAADSGRGVVLISPDLDELITTCDRILVMFNGRIRGEQKSGQFDYQSLALLMGGKL